MVKKKRSSGGFNTLTSCISTTLVLLLLGTVVLFVCVADGLSRSVRENFTVQVLLDDSIPNRDGLALQTELRQQPYVRLVDYISKERATHEQAEALGTDPAEFLGYSPIPASFELHLKADYAHPDSLNKFMPSVKKNKYVTDVVYPADLMEAVNDNIRRVSMVLLAVAVLLAFVSFALINNTMRLSVYARRFTIHSMKLVGAKWSFIRRPFMRRAFWIGFVSALLADGLLYAGMHFMLEWDANIGLLITPLVMLITLGCVMAVGLLLTLLCAFFSVNKHLRMSGSDVFLH